jgi:peptidoglycan/xylan/chitin deacetylase (PgdA/CDA1 family)
MGLTSLKSLLNRNVYVINYHSISGEDVDPVINNNIYRTRTEFEADIKFYLKHFNIVSAVDLIEIINNNEALPKDSLVLTFDDGLRINRLIHAPILKKYHVKATFFLNSAFIDNADMHFKRKNNLLLQRLKKKEYQHLRKHVRDYLNDHNIFEKNTIQSLNSINYRNRYHLDKIAEVLQLDFRAYLKKSKPYLSSGQVIEMLEEGFTIGAHSIDHPRYSELSREEQLHQTIGSMDFVARKFNLPYRLFAFPYNDLALDQAFYEEIRPFVDLAFGMRGFVDDSIDFSLQRAEVESTQLPIELALKYRFLTSYIGTIIK